MDTYVVHYFDPDLLKWVIDFQSYLSKRDAEQRAKDIMRELKSASLIFEIAYVRLNY